MSDPVNEWKNPQWLFNKLSGYIFGVILLFATISILIGLFEHKLRPDNIYALSLLLFILGVIRFGFSYYYDNTLIKQIVLNKGI